MLFALTLTLSLKGEGIGVVNPKFLAIAYCLLPNAFGYFRSTM